MTRRRASLRPFCLPLERPMVTAHGRIVERLGWLVELEDATGRRGFGEATPLPDFGTEDLATCRKALEAGLLAWVEQDEPDAGPGAHARVMDASAGALGVNAPCARAAIDSARFDLAARCGGRSLAAEVRDRAGQAGPPASHVAVQALVGGEDPARVAESARRFKAAGFQAFKLKLAVSRKHRDLAFDLERVSALREVVGAEARIRLDANEAWDRAQATAALVALAHFGVDYVEQPVARHDLLGLKRLSEEGAIPVAADEALLGEGLAACLAARAAAILIVKPSAIGGVSNSIRLWRRARDEGLRVVWSTLIDGAVGRAAPLALAAGLRAGDEVQGLGTASLLARDLIRRTESGSRAEGLDTQGRIFVSSDAGIGFVPMIPAGCEATRDAAMPSADASVSGGAFRSEGPGDSARPVFEVET